MRFRAEAIRPSLSPSSSLGSFFINPENCCSPRFVSLFHGTRWLWWTILAGEGGTLLAFSFFAGKEYQREISIPTVSAFQLILFSRLETNKRRFPLTAGVVYKQRVNFDANAESEDFSFFFFFLAFRAIKWRINSWVFRFRRAKWQLEMILYTRFV